jgi:hypothetical protein
MEVINSDAELALLDKMRQVERTVAYLVARQSVVRRRGFEDRVGVGATICAVVIVSTMRDAGLAFHNLLAAKSGEFKMLRDVVDAHRMLHYSAHPSSPAGDRIESSMRIVTDQIALSSGSEVEAKHTFQRRNTAKVFVYVGLLDHTIHRRRYIKTVGPATTVTVAHSAHTHTHTHTHTHARARAS